MARTIKKGLDYFPMDVDTDEKFELIEAKHELTGFAIVIKLYQRIYKNGYYLNWDEEKAYVFKKSINVDINTINDVINDCLKYDIFDQSKFDQFKILTSAGIQRRFMFACDRRKLVELDRNHIIVDINEFNVNINWVNEDIGTQRKEKKRKEQESKEKEENLLPFQVPKFYLETEQISAVLGSDQHWLEIVCIQNKIKTIDEVRSYLGKFENLLIERGEKGKSPVEQQAHFTNWLKIELQKAKSNGNSRRNIDKTKSHSDESL
jgi:Domain of unknown function (DUF4373)